MGRHEAPKPMGPGPHPTPEQSQALAEEFDRTYPAPKESAPPLPPTKPGPGTDAHGKRKH